MIRDRCQKNKDDYCQNYCSELGEAVEMKLIEDNNKNHQLPWSSIVSNVEKMNSSEGKKLWIVGLESQQLGNVFGRNTLYYMCRA